MSTLNTNNLYGPDWNDWTINMEGSSHLNVNGSFAMTAGAQLTLPRGTTAQRPASPTAGMIRYNTTTNIGEYYDGTQWVDMPKGATFDGASAATYADSAKQLYDDGLVTSGKGYRWINTSAGVKQVFCDFDTPDQDGNSGWMLVASFGEGYRWGGDGQNIITTDSVIDPGGSQHYSPSSNFYDMQITEFRVTANNSIETTLGASASADWYYRWNNPITWKEVWSPNAGNVRYYMSNGSNPSVQRCSMRKFDSSYNIKFAYNNPNHKYNNLSDFGYQGSRNDTADYSYGTIGNNQAGSSGFFDVWNAISNPGQQFEWFRVGRSANYAQRSGSDVDGSLAIPTQGANTDVSGQDVDSNIAAKVGNDDNNNWGGATSTATSNAGNNGAITTTPLWWWIK